MKSYLLTHLRVLKELLPSIQKESKKLLPKNEFSEIISSYFNVSDYFFYTTLGSCIKADGINPLLIASYSKDEIWNLVKKKRFNIFSNKSTFSKYNSR